MSDWAKPLNEISGITPATLSRDCIDIKNPIVFRGLVRDWELIEKSKCGMPATIDYLKSFYNGKPSLVVRGHQGVNGNYFYNDDFSDLNFDIIRMGINEALDLIGQSAINTELPTYYISSNGLDSHFPGLTQRNHFSPPRKEVEYPVHSVEAKIWIGNRSVAACHYDALDNIACVAVGKRRFTLFPPSEYSNLYFGPLDVTPGGQPISLVDFKNPDYEKFPNFKKAQESALTAILEPGDAIFIPSMWMHHVEGLDNFNILVNYWWTDAPTYTGSAVNVLYHALLSLRDKPEHEREAWKYILDHYVFSQNDQTFSHIPDAAKGVLGKLDDVKSRRLRAMIIDKLNR